MESGFVARASPAVARDGDGDGDGARPDAHRRERPVAALGMLGPHLDDDGVSDVLVNGDGSLWVDHGAGARRVPGVRVPAAEARELAIRLIAAGERHIDEATPCADVRLPGGLRVHAVLPPISTAGAVVSIRVARAEPWTLDALDSQGAFSTVPRRRIEELVARRANLLVTGAAGSGKTSLLAAMLAAAPPDERIVVLEDVAELRIGHPHVVALEARQPNLDGAGGVGLDRLVREALRMRPDRLVVGECRGAELRELLGALNTGHDGGAGTVHANSLRDVPARLEALGAVVGLAPGALARQAISAFDAVLHVARDATGARRVEAIGSLVLDEAGRLAVVVADADPP